MSKSGEAVINHGDAREGMPRKKETQMRKKKAWERRRAATRPTSLGRVNQKVIGADVREKMGNNSVETFSSLWGRAVPLSGMGSHGGLGGGAI